VRVLHPVHPTETLLYRGKYRYLKDDMPTGDVETWQVTRLADGTEIVRADLDGMSTRGENLITHFRRYPDSRPHWLRIRYRTDTVNAAAQYTFDKASIRIARQCEGYGRRIETLEIAENYVIDYHSVIAHDYVWRGYPGDAEGEPRAVPVFSPDLWEKADEVLKGRALRFSITPRREEPCVTPAGVFERAESFAITLSDGVEAVAWYNSNGIPLRWTYPLKGYEFILVAFQSGNETGRD
jgi:hypothetical protein